MEENNNSQFPQSPSDGQGNAEQPDIEKINKESTYWESNPVSQNPASTGQDQDASFVQNQSSSYGQNQGQAAYTQQSQPAQTPEQFYQFYQQQMNGSAGAQFGQQNTQFNQAQYNQPQYNQQAYNQTQNNQQAYNQAQFNQQQYNQQQYNQQQYNQQPYNQAQFNQQQFNQQQSNQQQYNQQQYYQPQYTQPQYNPAGYQPGTNQKPPRKKHRGALVALLVVILLLVSASGTAYAFRDTLSNSYAKMTKSPAEYYAYVEKNAVEDAVNELTSSENTLEETPDAAYHVTSDIGFDRDTLDSLMQSSLGMSLSDLEGSIGLPLESIGLDATVAKNGDVLNEILGVRLNQVNLITAELFMDTAAQKIFMRLPDLSQAYLSLSAEDALGSTDMSQLESITPEKTADLLNRYSNIIIDNINQAELEENAELTLDTLSTKCTKLTVTVTEQDAYNMVLEVLKEARDDEYILELVPMFQMTKEDYQSSIDEALAEMESSKDTITDESIQMVVYVNSKGEIIGRDFSISNSDISCSFAKLSNDGYEEYNFNVVDDTGTTVMNVTGSQTNDKGTYSGDAKIDVSANMDTLSNFSIDLSYENVHTEKKNNQTYQYGTFTLSSLDLMGLQVTMDCFVEDDIQKSKLVLQMGASPLVTVNSTIDYLEDYQVTMPSESAEVYDSADAESYAATFNLEDYISKLSEQLGVDLQSIIDSFSSDYNDY